jgi:hypothetical protein
MFFHIKKPSFGETAKGKKRKKAYIDAHGDGIFTTLILKGRIGINLFRQLLNDVVRRFI